MDKSCHSSGDSTATNASSNDNNRDQYLRHFNKLSHKISKPIRRPIFEFDHHHHNIHHQPPQPPPQSLQQQPPVYNIKMSDFRDVVQKLTGSPAHERFSTPPPIQPPKPPSSRLQRIRPPPLAQITNRPSPLLNNAVSSQPPPNTAAALNPNNPVNIAATPAVENNGDFCGNQRQVAPFSPLPPFPAVHATAESPISAYMRYLQNTVDTDPKRVSGLSPLSSLVSPKWNNVTQPQSPPNQQQSLPPAPQQPVLPSPTSAPMAQSPFLIPSSPLPFGCLPSSRSPYPVISPSLPLSPSTTGQLGFQQFPASPRLPVPSPRWKEI